MTQLGDVVLFLQWTATKYRVSLLYYHLHFLIHHVHIDSCLEQLVTHRLTVGDRVLDPNFLRTTDSVQRTEDQLPVFQSWSKALFDNGSEGIDDGILRYVLLQIVQNAALTNVIEMKINEAESSLEHGRDAVFGRDQCLCTGKDRRRCPQQWDFVLLGSFTQLDPGGHHKGYIERDSAH